MSTGNESGTGYTEDWKETVTWKRTRKSKGTRKYPSRREARQFMLNHKHINGRLLGTHRDIHATFTKHKHLSGMVFVKPKNKGE